MNWCPEPESNRYGGFTHPTDFKSVVSTNFTTRAESGKAERSTDEGSHRATTALYRDGLPVGESRPFPKWIEPERIVVFPENQG